MVIIIEIIEDEVVVDGNYLLVGILLIFDVEVVDVCDVIEEELVYGYVYVGGSCGGGEEY